METTQPVNRSVFNQSVEEQVLCSEYYGNQCGDNSTSYQSTFNQSIEEKVLCSHCLLFIISTVVVIIGLVAVVEAAAAAAAEVVVSLCSGQCRSLKA